MTPTRRYFQRIGATGPAGREPIPGGQAKMPAPPPMYVPTDARRRPSRAEVVAPEDELARRRASGTEAERLYGFEYLRRKKIIRPYDYVLPDLDGTAPPFALAASATQTGVITISKEADFELSKLMAVVDIPALGIVNGRNDDFTFRLKDDRKQVYLMSNPIHNLAGTGSAIFPLVLPDTKFFPRSSTVSIEMTNRRALAVNVWFTLRGKNYYAREFENLVNVPDFEKLSAQAKQFFVAKQKKFIEPYIFTMDTSPVVIAAASGQAADQVLNIRQEGDFEVFAFVAFASRGPFSVLMRESNTGRFLTSRELCSGDGIGDGERPALLDEPLFLDANSQVLCTFTDLSGVAGNTIWFALLGRKWFDSSSLNLTSGASFFYSKYDGM